MPIYNRIEYKKGELREHYREKNEKHSCIFVYAFCL